MKDKREQLPEGVTLMEYAEEILTRMPTSTLTHRETWALKEYVRQLEVLAGVYDDLAV